MSFRERQRFMRVAVRGNAAVDRPGSANRMRRRLARSGGTLDAQIVGSARDSMLQHQHAMQNTENGKLVSPQENRDAANDFVNAMMAQGVDAYLRGDSKTAAAHLGAALHTIQDSTSPEHGFDIPWDENASTMDQARHALGELGIQGDNAAYANRVRQKTDSAVRHFLESARSKEYQPRDWFPQE